MIIECAELKAQTGKMETDKRIWEAQQEVSLYEMASLKEQVVKLDEEVRCLNDRVGALSLENSGLIKQMVEL